MQDMQDYYDSTITLFFKTMTAMYDELYNECLATLKKPFLYYDFNDITLYRAPTDEKAEISNGDRYILHIMKQMYMYKKPMMVHIDLESATKTTEYRGNDIQTCIMCKGSTRNAHHRYLALQCYDAGNTMNMILDELMYGDDPNYDSRTSKTLDKYEEKEDEGVRLAVCYKCLAEDDYFDNRPLIHLIPSNRTFEVDHTFIMNN
jgi:hypothetical protein